MLLAFSPGDPMTPLHRPLAASLTGLLLIGACDSGLSALPKETADTASGRTTDSAAPSEPTDPTDSTSENNSAPVADAGDAPAGQVGEVVQLDGSNSYDPDEDPMAYFWEFISLPPTSTTYLINDTRTDPSFYADAEGNYIIRLTVDDGLATDMDEVELEVLAANGAPIADAGGDQVVSVGDTVQLNGSASTDPDGDAVNFSWSFVTRPGGSSAALDDPSSPLPTFAADAAGRFELSLVVDDGDSVSSADLVAITAEDEGDGGFCMQLASEASRERMASGGRSATPALLSLPILALMFFRRDA